MIFCVVLAVLPLFALGQPVGGYTKGDLNSAEALSLLTFLEMTMNADTPDASNNFFKVVKADKVETQVVNGINYKFSGLVLRETDCARDVKDSSNCMPTKSGDVHLCDIVVYKPITGKPSIHSSSCRSLGSYTKLDVKSKEAQDVLATIEKKMNEMSPDGETQFYKLVKTGGVMKQIVNGVSYRLTGVHMQETECAKTVKDFSNCQVEKDGKVYECHIEAYRPIGGDLQPASISCSHKPPQ